MAKFPLSAAGLVALADLSVIPERTALTGGASYLDALVLTPGLHMQQTATDLSKAEHPATAALTTGYVFRVENSATVYYLQRVGKTGTLVQLVVRNYKQPYEVNTLFQRLQHFLSDLVSEPGSSLFYLAGIILTFGALVFCISLREWWALTTLLALVLARLCNVAVIRRRSIPVWQGESEPGAHGDLLILLSQDRWIRMRGLVDDLKAVTAGEWMRDPNISESFITAAAKLLVYMAAALEGSNSTTGSMILLSLLLLSAGFLGASNYLLRTQRMHGKVIGVVGEPKKYGRRLDLAKQLIAETGRRDWAVALGMIVPDISTAVRATM